MAKVNIPKRVAGVKVPKKVRKQAKKALKLAVSPVARDLALTGLTLAAERVVEEARRNAGARPAEARVSDGEASKPERLDLGAILHAAVAEGARRFLEGFEEGIAAAARPATIKPSEKPERKEGSANGSEEPAPKRAKANRSAKAARPRASAKAGSNR